MVFLFLTIFNVLHTFYDSSILTEIVNSLSKVTLLEDILYGFAAAPSAVSNSDGGY